MRILFIAGNLQAVAPADLVNVPCAGAQVSQLDEGFTHEPGANAFKLIARSLARDALADGFGFE